MDGWMTCDFASFDGISVTSGRRVTMDDSERLCAMELLLRLKRVPPPAGLEPGIARSQAST